MKVEMELSADRNWSSPSNQTFTHALHSIYDMPRPRTRDVPPISFSLPTTHSASLAATPYYISDR